MAFSGVLVVAASLPPENRIRLCDEQPGFDPDLVTLEKGGPDNENTGVNAAAATSQPPLTGIKITGDFQAEAVGPNPSEGTPMARRRWKQSQVQFGGFQISW